MFNFNFNNMFNGMFAPVANGCCKISMDGKTAVKTSTGYKTFDINTRHLVNCDNFAFDMDNMFWVIPTFKVKCGDIILVNGKPHAVIEVGKTSIKTFSYENSTIVETVPEYHVFMGKTYCYGKIFSPFSNMMNSNNGMNDMMKMVMMSQMFGGNSTNDKFNPMMFMMFNGENNPFNSMFDGMFNFGNASNASNEDKEEN